MADRKRKKTKWPGVYRNTETGYYYVRGSALGVPGRKEYSLRTTKTTEVPSALKLVRLKMDRSGMAGTKMKFADVYDDYRVFRKSRLRPRTYELEQYIFDSHLIPFFREYTLAEIDDLVWDHYCECGKVKDYTNHRSAIRRYLKWCKRSRYIERMPDEFELPDHERRKRRAFSDHQILTIMKHAKGGLKLFLSMYLLMAMRRSEIMLLRWSQVKFDGGYIHLTKADTKTKRERFVPLHPAVQEILEARKDRAVSYKWVFPNAKDSSRHADPSGLKTSWATVKKRCKAEGVDIDEFTWHDLRSTWKTRAHKNVAFTDTQKEKFAGSSTEVQKGIYVDFDPKDLAGLEEAVSIPGLNNLLTGKGD